MLSRSAHLAPNHSRSTGTILFQLKTCVPAVKSTVFLGCVSDLSSSICNLAEAKHRSSPAALARLFRCTRVASLGRAVPLLLKGAASILSSRSSIKPAGSSSGQFLLLSTPSPPSQSLASQKLNPSKLLKFAHTPAARHCPAQTLIALSVPTH